ncbi:MAG: FG-GAP repeat domain-containing protein [Promethearchaeota archaeon]
MTIKKRFHQEWVFECPEAVLTCSVMKCGNETFLCFGGHDKSLYLMDMNTNIIDNVNFDGWCRCSFPVDLNGDGCDELLVGSGDGSLVVIKFDNQNKKVIGLKHYKSETKVICCCAGNLYKEGEISLIMGCEDKTLQIFKNLSSESPDITLYYDSWITSACTGFLKLSDRKEQVFGILVGTKNGLIQFVQIIEGSPQILWQSYLFSQINDIKVGDVNNDGISEVVVCTDDSYVKILDGNGIKLSYIHTTESRPVSLLIEDIDRDNALEILVGCADGSLLVFHNPKLNSLDFLLKWKANTRASIKTICAFLGKEDDIMHVVFGGYDRTLRNVYDFEYGNKSLLQVPSVKKHIFSLSKAASKALDEKASFPTSLREYIKKFLNDLKQEGILDGIKRKLIEIGYTPQEIDAELKLMSEQNLLTYQKFDMPVFTPQSQDNKLILEDSNNIEKKLVVRKKNDSKENKSSEKELEAENVDLDLEKAIISYLRQSKFINSKNNFINAMIEKGYEKKKVEQKINSLKENGIITYSRSAPRGWILRDNSKNSG